MADGPPIHDPLYGLPADEFVAARDRLVVELRGDGDRERAAKVKALRRPTVTAAALNRVLRGHPDELGELLSRAMAVADGQRVAMAGAVVDMQALQIAHRSAVQALAARADRDTDLISHLLEATSLDVNAHENLRAARFTEPPRPTAGFDVLRPLATVSSLDDARSAHRSRLEGRPTTKPAPPATDRPRDERAGPGQIDETEHRRPDERDGPADPSQTDERSDTPDEATPAPRGEAGVESNRLRGTGPALVLADRRLTAARRAEERAAERVAELERRLGAARRHLEDTKQRVAAAAAAQQRAEHEHDEGAE